MIKKQRVNTSKCREKTIIPSQPQPESKFVSILKSIGVDVKVNSLKFQDREKATIIDRNELVQISFTCRNHNDDAICCEDQIDRITIDLVLFSSGFQEVKTSVFEFGFNHVEHKLLDKYIEILDVDHERKHVYIRIKKTINTQDENALTYSYYLMGKNDQSQHAFLLDLGEVIEGRGTPFKNIDSIYHSYCMKSVKNRYYKTGKDGKTTFDKNADCSIKRVLIGAYFISTTTTGHPMRHYHFYTRRRCLSFKKDSDKVTYSLVTPRATNEGVTISCVNETYHHGEYGGIVSLGYYQLKLQVIHTFHVENHLLLASFRCKIVHMVPKC